MNTTHIQQQAEGAPELRIVDRVLAWISPLAGLLVAANIADQLLVGVKRWLWNDPRLARGVAMHYGYALYPGRNAVTPIIGTMHGPVGYLLYSCLAIFKNPTTALLTGCLLSCLLYFGTALWIHSMAGAPDLLPGIYGFLACAAMVLHSSGARYAAVTIHVDACALCCAMLAAGLLAFSENPPPRRTLLTSAVFAMLSVASKQTMAPVAVALPFFVLIVYGRRAVLQYVLAQIVSAAAILAAMAALFRPASDFLFNTFTLAITQPRAPSRLLRYGKALRALRLDLSVAVAVLLFLLLVFWFDSGTFREKIAKNRWLLFPWIAVFQLPVELRAWTTAGGDENHLGVVTLFTVLGATTGLVGLWRSGRRSLQWTARLLLAGLLVAHLTIPWRLPRLARSVANNPTQIAFNYDRQHPGQVYFPLNPLAVLLAEGKLRHFEPALLNRELGGFPLSAAQFSAGLPPSMEFVAYPRGTRHAAIIAGLLDGKPIVDLPGLEGWTVYRLR